MQPRAVKVAFLTTQADRVTHRTFPAMWERHVTAWDRACNTAPVSHLCVIIIDRRVG